MFSSHFFSYTPSPSLSLFNIFNSLYFFMFPRPLSLLNSLSIFDSSLLLFFHIFLSVSLSLYSYSLALSFFTFASLSSLQSFLLLFFYLNFVCVLLGGCSAVPLHVGAHQHRHHRQVEHRHKLEIKLL